MKKTLSKTMRYALALGVLLGHVVTASAAQAIERHLPVTPMGKSAPLAVPNALPEQQDDRPIGPALRMIALIGANEAVHDRPADGISIGNVSRLNSSEEKTVVAAFLTPYLGRSISRKLIAEIEAAIAAHYRALDYPFVSLSTPEQRIDTGVLHIRVIEFKAGEVVVKGTDQASAANIRRRVELQPGEEINAAELTQDLDWINRYPFRQVQAVFSPGSSLGTTNLMLMPQISKAWQVYGGYQNDGAPSSGRDRYYAGGNVGDILGRDSVLAAQATVSPDVLRGDSQPSYKSAALSYTVPLGLRGMIEADGDVIETYQDAGPFTSHLKASEVSAGYRFAAPDDFGIDDTVDVRVGAEAKHSNNVISFAGVSVFDVSMNVFQVYLGLAQGGGANNSASNWDLTLHFSPGGIGSENSSAQAAHYTSGRVTDMTYGYAKLSVDHVSVLPFDLKLKTQLFGQYAYQALPATEQMGLGGAYLVRGYSLDNGSFDSAGVFRNELHTSLIHSYAKSDVDPYLFADLGYGRDNALDKGTELFSVGVGTKIRIANLFTIKFDLACPLRNNGDVDSGDWFTSASLMASF